MDAVELAIPAVLVASKLMGPEEFGGVCGSAAGVRVEQVEVRDSKSVEVVVSTSSLSRQKESHIWGKTPNVDLYSSASQPTSFQNKGMAQELKIVGMDNSHLLISTPYSKKLQRKSEKVARTNSNNSKRSQVAQMEVSMIEPGHDAKESCDELGSFPGLQESTDVVKQKSNLSGRRGDKRNGKVFKSKGDSFSLKAGLVSFNSSAGGNNFLGLYGSKQDIYDVTKHVDELSLNELLDGSYKCPTFDKDKGKNASNLNDSILHSIRLACNLLQLRKPKQLQSSPFPLSSGSSLESINPEKGDTCPTDLSPCNKDSCGQLENSPSILDFPLYKPLDVLERLLLPPPKDLESLIIDASRPAVSSRNNANLRSGKSASVRGVLPPFSWSHTFSGHCKSHSDAVKLSSSRSTCQGRWVKMENSAAFFRGSNGFLADLESLTYDHSLVPLEDKRVGRSENENAPSASASFTNCELGISSCSINNLIPCAGHSPRSLAAAQILCEIATHSLMPTPDRTMRWSKQPSQTVVKACRLKSNEKLQMSSSAIGSDNLVKIANESLQSKKPRLSVSDKFNDLSHMMANGRGPLNWSTPRLSRTSPSKSFTKLVTQTKHDNVSVVRKSYMMPNFARVSAAMANFNQNKITKLASMEWNRADERTD